MLGVAWEWLVGHVWWTNAVFATLLVTFSAHLEASNPLAWVLLAFLLAVFWAPAGARMRRIFLRSYHRP